MTAPTVLMAEILTMKVFLQTTVFFHFSINQILLQQLFLFFIIISIITYSILVLLCLFLYFLICLQRERNVTYTGRQLVSQFNYLESHGWFDRRDRRSRIPFKPLPPGPVRPARMRQSERNMASNTISASSSIRMTSAPHSSVSTNSATHEVGNQFSYVDDSIMSSNSVRSFGGRRNRFAAKYRPRPKSPRPNPDAPDEDN